MPIGLPQRAPFPRSHACRTVPLPVLRRYADALSAWARIPECPGDGVCGPPSPVTLTEALDMAAA